MDAQRFRATLAVVPLVLGLAVTAGAQGLVPEEGSLIFSGDAKAAPASSQAVPCDACAPEKKADPPFPYKGMFYLNDFSYLDTTPRSEYYEYFKRMHLGGNLTMDVGGEYRHQFKNENRRSLFTGLPASPLADTYTLHRFRLYGNLAWRDWARAYVEFRHGDSFHEDLPPLPIDVDKMDILNAFGEVRLPIEPFGGKVLVRVGRQELLYGQQRLISPLDWSNTRRTFEGAKALYLSDSWDWEVFWTRPVVVDDVRLDQADQSQWFGGVVGNYKCFKNQKVLPYFLVLREEDSLAASTPSPFGGVRGGFPGAGGVGTSTVYTIGTEFIGGYNNWLWDVEAAVQLGKYGNQDVIAGMWASGIGRSMPNLPFKPTVWLWYDYASGDSDPNDSTVSTFNQLFPLGHKWMGLIDLVARQNVHDVNAQFFLKPHKKVTLLAWLHFFWLAEERDALYNAAGFASRQDPTGNSGQEIGQEIDLTASINVRKGVDLLLGYSHFWSGNFIQNLGGQDDAYLIYSQLQIKF